MFKSPQIKNASECQGSPIPNVEDVCVERNFDLISDELRQLDLTLKNEKPQAAVPKTLIPGIDVLTPAQMMDRSRAKLWPKIKSILPHVAIGFTSFLLSCVAMQSAVPLVVLGLAVIIFAALFATVVFMMSQSYSGLANWQFVALPVFMMCVVFGPIHGPLLAPFIEEIGLRMISRHSRDYAWLRLLFGCAEYMSNPTLIRLAPLFLFWTPTSYIYGQYSLIGLRYVMVCVCAHTTWNSLAVFVFDPMLTGSLQSIGLCWLIPVILTYCLFWLLVLRLVNSRLNAFCAELISHQMVQSRLLRRLAKRLKVPAANVFRYGDDIMCDSRFESQYVESMILPQSGKEKLDPIISVIEACIITVAQLKLCHTKKQVVLCLASLWKMLFPHQSLAGQFNDLCESTLGFGIGDLDDSLASVGKTVNKGIFAGFKRARDDIITPQSGFEKMLNTVKGYTSSARERRSDVEDSNVAYLLRFLMCKGILENIGITFSRLGFDKFEERAFRKKHSLWDTTKLVDYSVDVLRFGWKFFKYDDADVQLLIGGDKFSSFYERYSTIIDDNERQKMTAFDQLIEINELIGTAKKLGRRETVYVRFHERLLDLRAKVQSWQRNQKSRDPPFTMLLFSPPECGKTDLCYKLFRLYASVDEQATWTGENNVFAPNSAMKYWDNFVGQIFFLFDDIGCFRKDAKVVDELLTLLIQVINTVSMIPEKSNVEEKGKYACEPRMLIATTNTEDAGAKTIYKTVEAVLRRFNLHVTIRPKSHLCHPNSLKLRSDLTEEEQRSPWLLQISRYVITSDGSGWGGAYKPIRRFPQPDGTVIECGEEGVSYEHATYFISKEIEDHKHKGAQRLARMDELMDEDFYCEHHCLPNVCAVCSRQIVPQMGLTTVLLAPWYVLFWMLSWLFVFTLIGLSFSPFIALALIYVNRVALCETLQQMGVIPERSEYGPWLLRTWFHVIESKSKEGYQFGWCRRMILLWSYRFTAWYDHTLVNWRGYGDVLSATLAKMSTRHKVALSVLLTGIAASYFLSPSEAQISPQGGVESVPIGGDEKESPWRSNDMVPDIPFLTGATQTTTVEDLTAAVRKYTVVLSAGENCVFATPVGGQWFLTSTHFLEVDDTYRYRQLGENHLTFNAKFQLLPEDRRDLEGRDVSLIRIRSARNVRDFTKFFPLRVADFRSPKCFRTSSVDKPFETVVGGMLTSATSRIFGSPLYGAGSLSKVAVYSAEGREGDCGAPILVSKPGVFIAGVHIGYNGSDSCAAVVAQEDFEGLDKGPCDAEIDLGSDSHQKILTNVIHHKSVFRYIPEGCVKVFGSFVGFRRGPRSYVGPAVGAVVAAKYNIFPEFGKPVMKGYAPWRKNILAAISPVSLDMKKLQQCVDNFCQKLSNLPPSVTSKLHKLPLGVALNGFAGARFIDSMNLKSSAGFPYNKSKSHFVVRDPDPPDYAPDASLLTKEITQDLIRIMAHYEKGEMANPVFVGSLKDEPRTFKKVEEKNTRVFAGAPFAWCLIVRQYFLTFTRVFQSDHLLFENAVGIDVTSPEWGKLRQYFIDNKMLVFDGDYRKFDKKMINYLVAAAFDVMMFVCEQGDFDDEDLAIMRCIAADAANCTMDFNGELIQLISTNPSGNPLTVVINCIVNSLLQRYAYLCENDNLDDFNEKVQPINYGDDNITGNADGVNFNHLIMAKHMEAIGMGYTMADKEAEPKAYTDIEELEFLKRRFEVRDGWTYAPLNVQSINRMLTVSVYSRKVDRYEQAANALRSVLFEAYQHGEKTFGFYRAIVLEIIMEHNMMPYFETTGVYDFGYFERRRLETAKPAFDHVGQKPKDHLE